jgi:hypothetical protein
MKVIVTICSREKDHSTNNLPAHRRYTSPRIKQVRAIAHRKKRPFFILSGKYGFVAEDDSIPYYDNLLTGDAVDELLKRMCEQNKLLKITSMEFYGQPKKGRWVPYYDTVERFARTQNIHLDIIAT